MRTGSFQFRAALILPGLLAAGCDSFGSAVGGLAAGLARIFLIAGLLFMGSELLLIYLAVRKWGRAPSEMLVPLCASLLFLGTHALLAWTVFDDMQRSPGYASFESVGLCMTVLLPAFATLLALCGLWMGGAAGAAPRTGLGRGLLLAFLGTGLLGAGIYAAQVPWFATPVPAPGTPQLYAAGRSHACVLTSAGAALCWGQNAEGQLGTGPRPRARRVASAVVGLTGASAIVAGAEHTCVLRLGEVLCWGKNSDDVLGRGFPAMTAVPVPLPGITDAAELRALGNAMWIRRQSGAVLGLGSPADGKTAIAQDTAPEGTAELVGGDGFLCFRTTSGSVRCHVRFQGELDSYEVSRGLGTFTALAATLSDVCAVRADGTVWCWLPKQVAEDARQAQIDARRRCEIEKQMEEVLAASRQGRGARAAVLRKDKSDCAAAKSSDEPARGWSVLGLQDAVTLAASPDHLCATTRDGSVRCWGKGRDGQLGDGKVTNSSAPVAVSLPGRAAQVFAAPELSCASLVDGRIFCWGRDPLGIDGRAFKVCHETWLGKQWCAASPGPIVALPASR